MSCRRCQGWGVRDLDGIGCLNCGFHEYPGQITQADAIATVATDHKVDTLLLRAIALISEGAGELGAAAIP